MIDEDTGQDVTPLPLLQQDQAAVPRPTHGQSTTGGVNESTTTTGATVSKGLVLGKGVRIVCRRLIIYPIKQYFILK